VLEVEVLEFAMTGWGWTAIIPGFGLLADEFPDPWLKHWDAHARRAEGATFADGVDVPIAPFPGTIGLAPPTPGPHAPCRRTRGAATSTSST
jgi:acetamidase/formamidase